MDKVALAQRILSDSRTGGLTDHPPLSVGGLPSPGDTMSPLVHSFLLSRRIENCSPRTVETYEQRLLTLLRFIKKDPAAITKTDIELWLLHMKEGETKRGGKRSPFYVRSTYAAIRAFFNWMVSEGHIQKSPLANIKVPKVPRYEKDFLSDEDFHKLLSMCPVHTFAGVRDRAWLWLLWTTGARFSELANLGKDDLDWNTARIRVVGKGSKERRIPFTPEAQKAVYRYLQRREDKMPELWLSEERRPLKPLGVGQIVPRLADAASGYQCPQCSKRYQGLEFVCREYVCPVCKVKLTRLFNIQDAHHIFRRSWAWRNLKAGVPMKFVQLVGGWDSVTVMEQYVRRMSSDDALGGNIKWQ